MIKHFKEELVMTKEDEDFENPTKCWIYDSDYVDDDDDDDDDVKVRDYCHDTDRGYIEFIKRKYNIGLAHRDCRINVKLDHKILSYFTT